MTGSYPSPVWGHIEAFCKADRWDEVRSDTGHVFWEKTLPDGTVLRTHRSLDPTKRIGLNVFSRILRDQLRVSRERFWQAVVTGQPVERPVELEEPPPEYPAWVVSGLLRYGYTEEQIRQLTPEDAQALLHETWSFPHA